MRELVIKFLDVSGTKELAKKQIATLFDCLPDRHSMKETLLNRLYAIIDSDVFINNYVKFFNDNFTENEVESLIQSMDNPAVRKLMTFNKELGELFSKTFQKEIQSIIE